MSKLEVLLSKFSTGNSVKATQKILKILAKMPSAISWLPDEEHAGNYFAQIDIGDTGFIFRLGVRKYCWINPSFMIYEFEVEDISSSEKIPISYRIFGVECNCSSSVYHLNSEQRLSLKYGYFILELYNRVNFSLKKR